MKNATDSTEEMMTFLESAYAASLESRRLQRRLKELGERREKLKNRRGTVARKLEKLLAEESKREFAVACEEMECYRRVERFLSRIPGKLHRTILRRRYLESGSNWVEIGRTLEEDGAAYSVRHLIRLHAEALEEAWLLWKQEGEEGTTGKRR